MKMGITRSSNIPLTFKHYNASFDWPFNGWAWAIFAVLPASASDWWLILTANLWLLFAKVTILSWLWWQRWCSHFFPAAINMLLNMRWLKMFSHNVIGSRRTKKLQNSLEAKADDRHCGYRCGGKRRKIKFRRWWATQPWWFILLGLLQMLWQFVVSDQHENANSSSGSLAPPTSALPETVFSPSFVSACPSLSIDLLLTAERHRGRLTKGSRWLQPLDRPLHLWTGSLVYISRGAGTVIRSPQG